HDLIRQGEKLVENGEHVLEELLPLLATYNIGLNRELMAADDGSVNMPNTVENRVGYAKNSVEGAVLSVLEYDACSVDFVVAETGMSAAQVSSALIMLELDGAIVNTNSGYLLA
ncbi:MAG: DNA processing protein DprA, partial [Moraxellaceae bacterium]